MKKPCKACAAKIGAHHKKHSGKRIGGPSSHGWGSQLATTGATAIGMVAAHELKGVLPDSFRTSLGNNADYIINGVGALAGVGLPMLAEPGTDMHHYAASAGAGFAGQCLYALYAKMRAGEGQPVIKGWDNKAYSLAGIDNRQYALAGNVQRGMNGAVPFPKATPKVNATVPKPQAYSTAGYGA